MSDKRALGRQNQIVFSSWSDKERNDFWVAYSSNVKQHSNANEVHSFSPCHLWTGSTQNGYPAVSMGHAKSKVKMHILAAWTKLGIVPTATEVVSHWCHRKTCINPDHLGIESIKTNNQRKGCLCCIRGRGRQSIYSVCSHKPNCLRRDTEEVGFDFVPVVLYDPFDALYDKENMANN